jgi:hypothetical protein
MSQKQHSIHIDQTNVLIGMIIMVMSPVKWVVGLKNILNSSIPEGYQDESGFHFGTKAAVEKNHRTFADQVPHLIDTMNNR